jgi:hypothetical protein
LFGAEIPLAVFGGYDDVCVVLLSRKVINPLPLLIDISFDAASGWRLRQGLGLTL